MIKITGKTGKSEIASAIQKYNGAEIYSYYNTMLPLSIVIMSMMMNVAL